MAQAVPSNLMYAQAIELINQLRKDYAENKFRTPDEVSEIIKEIISRFDTGAGFVLTQFEQIHKGEPPRSEKMNRFWTNISSDVNVIQDQLDLLRASTVFTHNFHKVEILKAQLANSRLQNKIKTLQMYSQTNDPSIIKLGDAFLNDEFIEWELVDNSERATILSAGYIGLTPDEQKNDLMRKAGVKILGDSNGFLGNNQEVMDPNTAETDPVTGEKIYRFLTEENSASDLTALLDSEPNTWIEYENYKISDTDRGKAGNFNFTYKVSDQTTNVIGVEITSSGEVDWAKGPSGDTLSLELEVDLHESQTVNLIDFVPYGLAENKNNPIKVVSVSISETGTEWDLLNPQNVWIVNAIDKKLSILDSENVSINKATWVTNGVRTRYIRFKIEQPSSIPVNVGHLYYIKAASPLNNAQGTEAPQRIQGPVPPIDNPSFYLSPINSTIEGALQKREYFSGQRWAIGIRDINVKSNVYKQSGVFISRKFNIPGIIDRVAIEADMLIPDTFDQTNAWIKFYVSPNDGANWYQISRIQDDFLNIPEIIAFNDPTPAQLREPGVFYCDLPNVKVENLRVKVEFDRPSNDETATPILKSYMLKIKRR